MAERSNIQLHDRRENTRDQRTTPDAVNFSLREIYLHFEENIADIRAQFATADRLKQNRDTDGCEFIWRTQILYLSSALDYYVHELTTYGMIRMYRHLWPRTRNYEDTELSILALDEVNNRTGSNVWLVKYMTEAFSRDTLTSYARIRSQADLLGINMNACMKEAFPNPPDGETAVGYANRLLSELSVRRNRIAHQTDRNINNAEQSDITAEEVKRAIAHVESIVNALHQAAVRRG